jgi:hypothetical protein
LSFVSEDEKLIEPVTSVIFVVLRGEMGDERELSRKQKLALENI